jgi:hypothetical protein
VKIAARDGFSLRRRGQKWGLSRRAGAGNTNGVEKRFALVRPAITGQGKCEADEALGEAATGWSLPLKMSCSGRERPSCFEKSEVCFV